LLRCTSSTAGMGFGSVEGQSRVGCSGLKWVSGGGWWLVKWGCWLP
jgi:hypothetical protein